MRTHKPLRNGNRYRVWSYLASPAPARLATSRAVYPAAAQRFLEINGVWEDHVRYGFTVEEWAERRDHLLAAWM